MNAMIRRMALAASIVLAAAGSVGASHASVTPVAPRPATVLDAGLVAMLDAAEPGESLIVFVHGEGREDASRAARAVGLDVLERWEKVGVAVASGSAEAIRRLSADPSVTYIEPDRPVEMLLDTAHIATRAQEAREPAAGLLEPEGFPYDGTGVTIAIPDSGIDATHPMFVQDGTSKVVRNLRHACLESAPCSAWVEADDNDAADGHGTAVASVAAGYERVSARGRTVRGVAPGAKLVGLGSEGVYLYGHLSGFNWVLENHADPCGDGTCPPIRVMSYSGGSADSVTAAQLVEALVSEGITVTVAVGNDGGDGSQDNVSPLVHTTTPGVIGVANYEDNDIGSRDYGLDPSSGRGLRTDPSSYPDLAAPGTWITLACRATQRRCQPGLEADPDYSILTGTSLSAPYVAGVVALLVEANPALTPADIEDLLEDTAYQFGTADYVSDPTNPNHTTSFDRGHGLVDVTAALAAALERPAPYWSCGTGDIVDPEGDATALAEETGLSPPSADGLDITRAWVSTDPTTGALTFAVRLADLGELPPAAAVGEYLRFYFTYAGAPYEVHMQRLGGAAEASVRFHLQTAGSAIDRVIVADDLAGSFDHVADVVRAVVPASAFNDWNPAVPVVVDGDLLTGLQVTSNRPHGNRPAGPAFLIADTAKGACPHIVGS